MQHIIKKQIIQLGVSKKLDPFHMQQRMSEVYMQEMLPVLEKLFDEAAGEDQRLYIDSLEIDLGVISEKELNNKKWDKVLLIRLVKKGEEIIAQERAGAQEKTNYVIPKVLNICQQWIFYMQKGYLPWNALEVTYEWKEQVLEALAVDFTSVEVVTKLLKSNKKALSRIVEQHSEVFLLKLLEVITAKEQKEVLQLLQELEKVLPVYFEAKAKAGVLPQNRLRKQLWRQVFTIAAEQKGKISIRLTGLTLLQRFVIDPVELEKVVVKRKKRIPVLLPIIKQWIEEAGMHSADQQTKNLAAPEKEHAGRKEKKASDQEKEEKGKIQMTGKGGPEEKRAIYDEQQDALKREKQNAVYVDQKSADEIRKSEEDIHEGSVNQERSLVSIDEEGIFVTNAGIVLLHPFLSMFFNFLELVEDGKFKDDVAQQKALYLLHYLATGETGAEESDLVVPKVLLNFPLEEPVEKEVFLTEEALEEADHLLKVVIKQWEKLKNSSPDELRGGFLQRSAKLFTKNESLYLQFERDSIDILLDYLPWNLSIIKLPWMQEFLHVEWR